MKINKGDALFIKCTIGIASHFRASKVEVVSIRKVNGKVYSFRCRQIEELTLKDGFSRNSSKSLITYRMSLIGIDKPYQVFKQKSNFLIALNNYFDNQHKLIEIGRNECSYFSS